MAVQKPLVVAAALGLALAVAACDEVGISVSGERGSGVLTTESRQVSEFDEIAVLGSGRVLVDVTGTESLTINAEDNIIPLLSTEVVNGRLELKPESSINPTRPVMYIITAASLHGVSVEGSGDVLALGIDSRDFNVEIAGSGNVEPAGATSDLRVSIAGSGNYDGDNLVAGSGEVNVAGSGNAVVHVTGDLEVTIDGSGDVRYMGSPEVRSSVNGSGNVSGQ